ncbi:cation diffusion facilitator family metal ion transporter [Aspergillus ambiguus]|uniref:putative di-, tri-valent inorganic cation transporter n=1 Tax=Aspergillus ambiguus TaxID=176160 RepID=UPI003CCD4483
MVLKISRTARLSAVIAISSLFFLAEISVGFYTHSLALVADAFHYLNDLVGFVVALVALRVSETSEHPPSRLSFGWQRAPLLGAFFNGVLLLALGISVFLQSIERFVALQPVENPMLMFIMGAVGLALNLLSVAFLHEHHGHDHGHAHGGKADELHVRSNPHGHEHDLGMMGVLLHVIGDAANNLGVMAAALVIWLARYEGRFYADPGTSMGISVMIMLSSIPLVRNSGMILLQSAPNDVDPTLVQMDLEKIPGILAVHELHIWRLNQQKTLASVHIVMAAGPAPDWAGLTRAVNECFHTYGIHSATLQPEILDGVMAENEKCRVMCSEVCEEFTCCGNTSI